MSNLNRGRYAAELSGAWRKYAEPLPGLEFIGLVTRKNVISGLAKDEKGAFFAVNGRFAEPLVTRKVEKALGLESRAASAISQASPADPT